MRTRRTFVTRWTLAAAAALAATAVPATVLACGGFFCNNLPMDQTAEEIIFSVDEANHHVEAIIKISYQGRAEDFAWVLPVQSAPTRFDVSVNAIFPAIRTVTDPRFNIEWVGGSPGCLGIWELDADAGGPPNAGAGGGVTVLDTGQVGPYDYAVLESGDAEELVAWLNENEFVQPPESTPLIEHYVAGGFKFVALKLQQNKGTGDIVPIVIGLDETSPCVPLVLTAIAAQPDMPVRIWVLGSARAVPSNWFAVDINLKKIDWVGAWFAGGTAPNYMDVLTAAIDEAAGHGFVTEYAGTSDLLEALVYTPDRFDLDALASTTSPAEFIYAVQSQFPPSGDLLAVFRELFPVNPDLLGDGVTEQNVYNCPDCYPEAFADVDFDPVAATALVEERIVQPLADAQAMFDAFPYLTRMTTTVSPDEMTRDPLFHFNADLPDVSNVHTATGEVICDEGDLQQVLLTLPDGTTFAASVPDWFGMPPELGADDVSQEPAAASVAVVPSAGAPVPVTPDQVAYYDTQLDLVTVDDLLGTVGAQPPQDGPEQPGAGTPTGSGGLDQGGGSGGGGCTAGAGALGPAFGLLGMLGLAGWRRRRHT